jgi:hypothetical protein
MPAMTDFRDHEPFSDQELVLLFRQYLPLQPLPAELARQITLLVLAEVAISLKRQASGLTWLSPVMLRSWLKTWFRR